MMYKNNNIILAGMLKSYKNGNAIFSTIWCLGTR